MLTHIVHHIFRTARPTPYKLQTWYTDGGQRPASSTGAMTFKVKVQGRKVILSRLGPQCSSIIRGRQGHTVSAKLQTTL